MFEKIIEIKCIFMVILRSTLRFRYMSIFCRSLVPNLTHFFKSYTYLLVKWQIFWEQHFRVCNCFIVYFTGEKIDPSRAFQSPTNQQLSSLCRSVFPASPAELKSTTATSATNAQTPLQAQQPQAPSIVLSHIESQSLQVSDNIVLTRRNENEKFRQRLSVVLVKQLCLFGFEQFC